ncbi:MAG: hypothetical protein ACR2QR_07410 [Woeseiaceae bacterium]
MNGRNGVLYFLKLLFSVCVVAPAFAQQPERPDQISIDAFAQLPVMRDPELSPDG